MHCALCTVQQKSYDPIIKSQIDTGDNGEEGDKESPEWRNSELVAFGSCCYHYALCPVHCALCPVHYALHSKSCSL